MTSPRVPRPRARRVIRPAKAPASVPPPLTGVWAPTDTRLDRPDLFPLPSGAGPEDVAVEPDGCVVAGGDDGRIWRWRAGARPGDPPSLVADTGGRPLGIEVDSRDGSLVVCDGYRGLLRVTRDGRVEELAREAAGRPILVCDNSTIGADGTVYFSDSSNRYPLHAWKRDIAEHRPNGRLLAYRPGTGRAEVVADGLYFPNGVALTPDGGALLVAETTTHRLLRVPLAAGDPVELVDLPAYPDNISAVGDGTYWVALPSPRVPIAERLLPYPGMRRAALLLPEVLQPKPKRYGLVALVGADGTVLRTLHGPSGRYRMITGVRQAGGELWLGSLVERAVARVSL
ncbi:MAG TPA: SMP-30/gluconolactonase/LRE family protein [Micromonosporaceae bacterium]|jgi:sugar lactone lactonase YvrE